MNKHKQLTSNPDVGPENVKAWFVNQREDVTCLFENPTDWPRVNQIIKYRVKPFTALAAWREPLIAGVIVTGLTCLILANVYYRGLIFIVFGKRP